jgi:hypothetical protein
MRSAGTARMSKTASRVTSRRRLRLCVLLQISAAASGDGYEYGLLGNRSLMPPREGVGELVDFAHSEEKRSR